MIRTSPINKAASATITASSQDATYVANNIRHPERPTFPARTTVTTQSWWVVNFGSAQTIDSIALIWTNFTSVQIQFNGTDSWGTPAYDSGLLTVGQNPGHGRYHLHHRPAAQQNQQFMRILVPSQTPVDGAGYFRLGGVHAGVNILPLDDVLVDYSLMSVEPFLDVQPDHRGWRARLDMGPAITSLKLGRLHKLGTVPGVSDDLAAWLALEWAWKNADYAMVNLRDDLTSWVWIMRRMTLPTFALSSKVGSSPLELEEVLRP